MSRLPPIDPAEMTPAQRTVHDDILAGPRGKISGPFAAWLRSPELADRAQKLGAFCRFHSSLPPRLSELAILVTATHWRAQVEFAVHARIAADAGVGADVIEALRLGRKPVFEAEDEALVHDVVATLLSSRRLPDSLYGRAVARLGETTMVELIAIVGYYGLVALTLNAFKVAVPEGLAIPFEDPA